MTEDTNERARRRLLELSGSEREAFCRQVLEGLSDLVEGEAPADLCERVDEILGDCQAFVAYKRTLSSTIDLVGECRDRDTIASELDGESFRRCVEEVRGRLAESSDDPTGQD